MSEKEEILKKIKVENFIWIIYLVIIGISFYSNSLEERYIKYNDLKAKRNYQKNIIIIFSIAVAVYIYFFLDNYKDVKNLKPWDSNRKKKLNEASLFASTLVLISGLIFLYIAIVDENIDVELAFN